MNKLFLPLTLVATVFFFFACQQQSPQSSMSLKVLDEKEESPESFLLTYGRYHYGSFANREAALEMLLPVDRELTFEHKGKKYWFLLVHQLSLGTSHHEYYCLVFNEISNQWEQKLKCHLTNLLSADIELDKENDQCVLRGAANNELKSKPVLTIDLRGL